jgi:hypothetical protein
MLRKSHNKDPLDEKLSTMKFAHAVPLLILSLATTVVAPTGNKFRSQHVHEQQGPPDHARGRGPLADYDSGAPDIEISYLIKYPTRFNFVDANNPFQTPGDEALFDDPIFKDDKKTVIGRIFGFCILTDVPIPNKPSGSAYCQTPVSLDTYVNGKHVQGTFTTAGVIFNPAGLGFQQASEGISTITGGTGDLKYAQGTVELKQLDETWISEKASIRLNYCGGSKW